MSVIRHVLLFMFIFSPIGFSYAQPILVETDWLAKNMSSTNVVIIDMSDSMQYSRFHIPGSRYLPYQAINQHTRKQISLSIGSENIAKILGQLGVAPENHIVIYDDIGGLNASRLFWELERLGHQKVSLLNGGLVKWILEGRKVIASPPAYQKTRYTYDKNKGKQNLFRINEFNTGKQSNSTLLDVRSQEEYTGHPKQVRSGHIPGALWWNWEENIDFENAFKLKDEKKLQAQASSLGLKDKNNQIIVYCRSGHRASQSYFTLRKLGYNNIRLYDGSMAEYMQDKNRELKRGNQP